MKNYKNNSKPGSVYLAEVTFPNGDKEIYTGMTLRPVWKRWSEHMKKIGGVYTSRAISFRPLAAFKSFNPRKAEKTIKHMSRSKKIWFARMIAKRYNKKMKPRIIYIHGNQTSHWSFAWAPWLKMELEKRGFETFFETMPDSIIARSEYWIPFIENHIKPTEKDILIGYSSGAVAVMRYAEKHKVGGIILIGACHTDLGDELEKQSGYYDKPWDWNSIKNNQDWIVQFGSVNDPVIPIEESRFVNKMLDTEYTEFENKFHFGWPEHMEEFPELLDSIISKS